MASKMEDGAEMTDLKQAEQTFQALMTSVADLSSAGESSKLFKNGITHVKVDLTFGGVTLGVDISGPDKSAGSGDLGALGTLVTKSAWIKLEANGEGVIEFDGKSYACLGSPAHDYPTDLTVTGEIGKDKFRSKFSNEFQVTMNYAILIWGQKGIYVHLGADNLAQNGGPSAGCIHLADGHAQEFYDWVDGPTRIRIKYPW